MLESMRGRKIHPWASTTALFLNNIVEISYVSISQKQALVNANQYVCSLTLICPRRHPSVSLRCKGSNNFAIMQE
jgi:hypothetical protein